MPSNPSIIPGVYGFGDDLASAFASIGQGLAMVGIAEKLKIEKAMESFRDPVFMEKAAMDLAGAQRRDELNPDYADVAADATRQSELSRTQDSYMLAAGLDPTNPKHRQAALGILGTAYQSLPAAQRAQARLDQDKEFRKREEKIAKTEQETRKVTGETALTDVSMASEALTLARSLGVHLDDVTIKALSNDLMITALKMRSANTAQREELLAQIPTLAALYSVSDEAFVEGLLKLMGGQAGPETLSVPDIAILQEKREERDANFLMQLQEASQLSGDEALAALTKALQGRESYEVFGRLLPQSAFPLGFETYLAGWLRATPRVQLMFSLPPFDPAGATLQAEGWAKWINGLADMYESAKSPEEKKQVQAFLLNSDLWKVMSTKQREQTVAQLTGLNVLFPDLVIQFRAERAAREAEFEARKEEGMSYRREAEEIEAKTGVRPIKDE